MSHSKHVEINLAVGSETLALILGMTFDRDGPFLVTRVYSDPDSIISSMDYPCDCVSDVVAAPDRLRL